MLESFQKSGVYDHTIGPAGFNMKTMFRQLMKYEGDKLALADETAIVNAMPNLMEQLRTKVELVEQDYDDNTIRCNIKGLGSAKDQLHMSRKRYVFVTNPALIASETIKKASAMLKKSTRVRKISKASVKLMSAGAPISSVTSSVGSMHNEPINALVHAAVYYCGNPACGSACEQDADWLECKCCNPCCWTCALCAEFIGRHERLFTFKA